MVQINEDCDVFYVNRKKEVIVLGIFGILYGCVPFHGFSWKKRKFVRIHNFSIFGYIEFFFLFF
jgi:hypothetical protein